MSIVTIKWQGDEKWGQALSFEYTGGCSFEIYKNIISLLTAIKNNFEDDERMKRGLL